MGHASVCVRARARVRGHARVRTHASADFQFHIRWDCTRGGTPLQNNLTELWSLLHFTLPAIFQDLETFKSLALTRPRRLPLRSIRSPSVGRCGLLATDCTTVALSCAPQRHCAVCWWSRCAALRACASLRCNRHPSSRTGSTSMRRWARVARDRHDALVASPASASSCRMVNAARRTHAACARPSVGGMDAASVSRPQRTGSRARGELSTAGPRALWALDRRISTAVRQYFGE